MAFVYKLNGESIVYSNRLENLEASTSFSSMLLIQTLPLILIVFTHHTHHLCSALPSYQSLGGLSERELEDAMVELSSEAVYPPAPPPRMEFNGTKLVNDEAHPWMPLREGDIRGPCPGLNTLASHGVRLIYVRPFRISLILITLKLKYLPRDGVVTPAQVITAVQEGGWAPAKMDTVNRPV